MPSYDLSPDNLSSAISDFRLILGAHAVSTDDHETAKRSGNEWSPAQLQQGQRYEAVLFPSTTAQVSQVMAICNERKLPVTGYAGGTSMPGAILASHGGICVDFARMDAVLEVHKRDMDAVVQPGVTWTRLNEVLGSEDVFFPPDPAPWAKIGGMIAMNCAGTNAYRYGTMKEWIIGLTVVLADGQIIRTRRRPRKSSAGYDLTQLMVGSEGTLGLVTEATIRVAPKPQNIHVAVAAFPFPSAAIDTAVDLVCSGINAEAIELLDRGCMRSVNLSKLSSTRRWQEVPTLFLKFAGKPNLVEEMISQARQAATSHGVIDFDVSHAESGIEEIWSARKNVGNTIGCLRSSETDVHILNDVAVPISRVAELLDMAYELHHQRLPTGSSSIAIIAHAGSGNLHVEIVCAAEQEQAGKQLLSEIERAAVDMDGTVTGEHGVGTKLREQVIYELGEATVDVMRKIKLALDPNGILNPGKVFLL